MTHQKKALFAALAIAVCLVATLRSTFALQRKPEDLVLTEGRAGWLELGMPIDDVYQMFGRDNVSLVAEFREGAFSPVIMIKAPGALTSPAFSVDIREWPCGYFSVWGIRVLDDRFRTKDGFGVGSTAAALRQAHPFEIAEDEGAHAAIVNDLQMSFFLTRQGPVDQQKVTSVWIWPDPDSVRKKRCPDRR